MWLHMPTHVNRLVVHKRLTQTLTNGIVNKGQFKLLIYVSTNDFVTIDIEMLQRIRQY